MDILKNKSYGTFDYTCRYTTVPYYYNTEDNKYMFGLGTNMKKDSPYTLHKVEQTDTLWSLSLNYYANPTYWWVIAYFNDIQDAFISLPENYTTLKIPNISSIEFGDER